MASNTSNNQMQDESLAENKAHTKKLLEDHLRKIHVSSEDRDRVIEGSREEVRKARNSADADALSRSQKEKKIENFLQQKKGSQRRRRKRKITRSDVRAQAEKILEEFLQKQLQQQAIQTSSPEYQRYVELDVTENTTPSGSSGFQSSSNALRQDSIPFADESDTEHGLRKAESLPHDELNEIPFGCYQTNKGLPIHHEKSKSAPYYHDEAETGMRGRKRSNYIRPPPPPPPGTPHNPSGNSSDSLSNFRPPVPYTGGNEDNKSAECSGNISSLERRHSPAKKPMPATAPGSLTLSSYPTSSSRSYTPSSDISYNGDMGARAKSRDSRSGSPTKSPHSMKQFGYTTSSDSDSGKHYAKGRKKKSMFKKAQERVQTLLKMHSKSKSANEDQIDNDYHSDPKPKFKKKHTKKHVESHDEHVDEADIFEPEGGVKVLEDTHMHTSKHIHQSHWNGDKTKILRSTDSFEIVDTKNDKGKKHVEKHMKMKESSGNGGFMGKLRRLTTRDKGNKHSHENMKGSKSTEWAESAAGCDKVDFSRTVSVPAHDYHGAVSELAVDGIDDTRNGHLHMYSRGQGFAFSAGENHAVGPNSQRLTANQVVSRQEDQGDMKRNSSYLDIVDYGGNMIDRLYFDAQGRDLPRNKSFEFDQEVCVHEKRVDDHGKVRLIRDVGHWDHMEIDGDADDDSRELDDKDLSNTTEAEKDELYGKIANRLAFIGDNFMSEKELDRSRSVSPRSKLSDDQKCVEEEITKTDLTPLEQEIRDELRRFADDMDDKLAANARTAALRISGLVTYNHFRDAVQDSVGNGDGWAQVAAVFHITKRAVQMAGASGALAMQIKELSLKYIEDRFAGWIIGQGGWDSMLSEDESETDSELD